MPGPRRISQTLAIIASLLPASGLAAQQPPQARALLIGIADYQSPTMQDLGGPRNDVAKMQQVLHTRLGFPLAGIRKLLDGEATRTRILAALRQVVAETGPKDLLYIHFSGHGSQVKDLNGDETDGLDETLVPCDGRQEGIPDIVDDELDRILSKVKTPHLLVVLDACHSGTGTRHGAGQVCQKREVPPETEARLGLYNHLRTRTRDTRPTETHGVLMTGAAASQTALDGPVGGQLYGFFSYALAQALGHARQGADTASVFAQANREHQRIQQQFDLLDLRQAQLEAPKSRLQQPLWPTLPGASRLVWLAARASGKSGELVLPGGRALGAVPGSHWAIYPADERHFAPGKAIAWGTVFENPGENAWLRLSWTRPGTTQLQAGRAVALAPAGAKGLPVRIEGGSQSQRLAMQQALQTAVKGIAFVGDRQFARFTVDLQPVAHRLLAADGLEVLQTVPATAAGTLQVTRLLSRSAMSTELLSLQNPASRMQLDLRIAGQAPAPAPQLRQRGVKLVGNSAAARFVIRQEGAPRSPRNSLVLEVQTDQNCYLTVVDVDSEGGVNVLFPNPISEAQGFYPAGQIPGGRPVRIPDSLAENNRAQFWFDYADPVGVDTLRVFASNDLATATLIRRSMANIAAAPRQFGDAETPALDPRQGLIQALKARLNTVLTRGIKLASNRPRTQNTSSPAAAADWTAASLTIRVQAQ